MNAGPSQHTLVCICIFVCMWLMSLVCFDCFCFDCVHDFFFTFFFFLLCFSSPIFQFFQFNSHKHLTFNTFGIQFDWNVLLNCCLFDLHTPSRNTVYVELFVTRSNLKLTLCLVGYRISILLINGIRIPQPAHRTNVKRYAKRHTVIV